MDRGFVFSDTTWQKASKNLHFSRHIFFAKFRDFFRRLPWLLAVGPYSLRLVFHFFTQNAVDSLRFISLPPFLLPSPFQRILRPFYGGPNCPDYHLNPLILHYDRLKYLWYLFNLLKLCKRLRKSNRYALQSQPQAKNFDYSHPL